MEFTTNLRQKAAALARTIVLPESGDDRTLKAAVRIRDEGFASIILLGDPGALSGDFEKLGLDGTGLEIIDPLRADCRDEFITAFYERRKHKGLTAADAARTLEDPLFFGAMLVSTGRAHGMVAGAANATSDVLRAGFQVIGTAPDSSLVSSCFVMIKSDWEFGENGMIVFGDCAVNPNPDANQLADIAVATARTARSLCGFEPKVAMLSYSTMGSGTGADVDKVSEAVRLIQKKAPELPVDGPLQLDAAIVPAVGAKKAPGSNVAGRANVVIFPDLDAGNIGYKLVQRLAGATAIGPVLQGMARGVNDLSRGCSVDDIVNVVAITALQSDG